MTLVLDHVALGVADAAPVLRRLTAELGATVIGGGTPERTGFRVVHAHLGEPDDVGMTIELLEPHQPEHNDFLERFVRTRGDGPHHITFKTSDIVAEHERLVELGLEPIGLRLHTPPWREMFLHPKAAHGVVVQIAQSDSNHPPMPERLRAARQEDQTFDGKQRWWSESAAGRARESVRLRAVVMEAVAPDTAVAFWVEVMGGEDRADGLWWSGGRIRVGPGDRDGVKALEVQGIDGPMEVGGTALVPG